MMHHKQVELEKKMKSLFDEIDDILEERYHDSWLLHPNRQKRGMCANKEADGLFNVGASFSAGFGTNYGRGYVIDVSISTLEHIPFSVKETIYKEVSFLIQERLPVFFPERKLEVVKDGAVYKIIGDFSLGSV